MIAPSMPAEKAQNANFNRLLGRLTGRANGYGARPFAALSDLVFDRFPLAEIVKRPTPDFRIMEEQIFAVTLNETETAIFH